MKYLCLVYLDEQRLDELPDEDCVAYDTAIRSSGHCLASEALQSVHTATTVRVRGGKVSVTDGGQPRPAGPPALPGRRPGPGQLRGDQAQRRRRAGHQLPVALGGRGTVGLRRAGRAAQQPAAVAPAFLHAAPARQVPLAGLRALLGTLSGGTRRRLAGSRQKDPPAAPDARRGMKKEPGTALSVSLAFSGSRPLHSASRWR
ncbi:dehydrogenase (plasmid) [Pseudomonas aeruginosa VRFPA03]|nr:dehydrogenase [Pseudomonas aeruginosa VRFPA03]